MKSTSLTVFSLAGLCWALAGAPAAPGPFTFPERPGPRDFLLDQAEVLDPGQAGRLRRTCDRLLTDTATPIIVVTLRSLADHAPQGATPEDYARALFNHWQIGHARVNGQPWDTGILVLWVQDMGRIRVELGRGWGHAKDEETARILAERMRPRREAGDVAGGLVATVEALATMARQRPLPQAATLPRAAPASTTEDARLHPLLIPGGLALVILLFVVSVAIARHRRGRPAGVPPDEDPRRGRARGSGGTIPSPGDSRGGVLPSRHDSSSWGGGSTTSTPPADPGGGSSAGGSSAPGGGGFGGGSFGDGGAGGGGASG